MTPLAFAEAAFPIIPVRIAPKPNGGWRKMPMAKWSLATTDENVIEGWWRTWPDALPGIPLARMGWAVVDADRREGKADGVAAVTDIGCLGPHSKIATPSGGLHLVFAQPAQPIEGRFNWCEGVEVLGEGCLLTCYDLEELKFPHVAPRAILPEMFWKPRDAQCRERSPIKKTRAVSPDAMGPDAVLVADYVEALRKLNVVDFRDYAGWFALMTGASYVGISERDFVDWSVSDPRYAADGPLIRKMWRKLRPAHGGAFWAALKRAGIRVTRSSLINGEPLPASMHSTRNWRSRIDSVRCKLRAVATEGMLFSASCVFAEVMADTGKPKLRVAVQLLEEDAQACGLWQTLGPDECRRTITNGLRYVEEKILATEEITAK